MWNGIVLLLGWLAGGALDERRAADPTEARYVRGEFTRGQFGRMKRALECQGP